MKNVSVIIPTYNRKDETVNAIRSVLQQTAIDRIGEIIVIDDGSTDGTTEELMLFNKRRKDKSVEIVLRRQKNAGAAHARNIAMSIAKYPLIAFLDSDDIWVSNKVAEQLYVFDSDETIDFVGCNTMKQKLKLPFTKVENLHKIRIIDMWYKSFPTTSSVMLRRKIYQEIGGFDEELMRYEDCDYWQRICLKGFNMYHLQMPLVKLDSKMPYGEAGLSADINAIAQDVNRSAEKLYKNNYISLPIFLLLFSYNQIKNLRRKVIVFMRQINK